MTTFALVHGAWHGAWCWERLTPELEALDHRAITMDLPSDDPAATFDTYAEAVVQAIDQEDDQVVVVGHSLAGLTIPLVAARRPVAHLVFVCALVPLPGRAFAEQLGSDSSPLLPEYLAGIESDDAGAGRWADPGLAREILFADCEPEVARAAVERLRPQARTPYGVACSLDAWPDVSSTYVVCGNDRLVDPAWSREVATNRLNADLVELPGSHSPFLSRPQELAAVLAAIGAGARVSRDEPGRGPQ